MANKIPDGEDSYIEDALQIAPIGAFLADMEGNCFFVNKAWEKISGLSAAQSRGKGWLKNVLKEDAAEVSGALQRAAQSPLVNYSYRTVHPKTGIRYCSASVRAVSGPRGEYPSVMWKTRPTISRRKTNSWN
jgi:PAS domain S-box-containing protein